MRNVAAYLVQKVCQIYVTFIPKENILEEGDFGMT